MEYTAELKALKNEVRELRSALEKTLAYTGRLKKERDGARGENAALKSKLADAHTDTIQDALAHAAAHPQSGYADITSFLPALAEVGKARREQEAMTPAERAEKAVKKLRGLK